MNKLLSQLASQILTAPSDIKGTDFKIHSAPFSQAIQALMAIIQQLGHCLTTESWKLHHPLPYLHHASQKSSKVNNMNFVHPIAFLLLKIWIK